MGQTYEEIMELVEKTSKNVAANIENPSALVNELKSQRLLLGGLANTVNGINDHMATIDNELSQLKSNEEITTAQSESLRRAAVKRVMEILGNDPFDQQKYLRIFIRRLYTDTRKNAGLGSKIDRTRKGDFQRCIDYIESWIPSCGCACLKDKADIYAQARRQAKTLGYTS